MVYIGTLLILNIHIATMNSGETFQQRSSLFTNILLYHCSLLLHV